MSEVKQRKLPDMMVSPSKLSFQIHSPLFRLDTLSPTFTISLSGAHGVVGDTKTTGLDVSRTSSAMPGTPGRLNKAAAVSAVGLSPLPRGDDMPMTSKSTELQNRMIDEQLEMLGELFPKQLNRASQDKLPSASPDSISRVDEKTEKLSTSESSGFQNSPVSDTFALSSNWPKLPEEDGVASASQRTSSASEGPIHSEKPIAEDSPDLSASADKPLIQRRSLAPTLRVNTTESQRYATKELVLIRKMKEEGRIKAENKVSWSYVCVRDCTSLF